MAIVNSIKFTHPFLGTVALAFLVAYKNDGGYLRAECHMVYSDQSVSPVSVSIKFQQAPQEPGTVAVTEQVMCDIARDEAKTRFEQYCNDQSEVRRELLSHTVASEAKPEDLLRAWVRQLFPKMYDIAYQTECEELRDHIRSFTAYAPITVRAL